MTHTHRSALAIIATATAVITGLGLPPVNAAESTNTAPANQTNSNLVGTPHAGTILAHDLTAITATKNPTKTAPALIGIDAHAVNAVTITAPARSTVTISAKGQTTQSKKIADGGTKATFTKLAAGTTYSVAVNGKKVGSAVPLATAGPAHGLQVATTGNATSALLTWDYTPTPRAGAITFDISATPVAGQAIARNLDPGTTRTTSSKQFVIEELNPDVLYTFTITPRNSASVGKSSQATIPMTLAQANGQLSAPERQAAAQKARLAEEAAAKAAAARTNLTPTPPSAPATKTIYVCPAGFIDIGSQCQQSTAYTYTQAVTTTAYTFHSEATGPAPILESYEVFNNSCPAGFNLENYGPNGTWCRLYGAPPTQQVKDAPPAGFTDNGTTYMRTVQVKNNTPTGYTDDGSAWVKTVAKEAKVVPA